MTTSSYVEKGKEPCGIEQASGINSTDKTKAENHVSIVVQQVLAVFCWIPPWCRYDEQRPPKFSVWLNLLFAFAVAFTVADLYYNHPILHILARDFGVSEVEVSRIPTLMQAGYAVGLVFLCPLGDVVKRRSFTLLLVGFTTVVWIGLCTTNSYELFCTLSFITSVTTVTPQIMVPLVADLTPPSKRPLAISIVGSGGMFGILVARILSGVVTNYTDWRNIYWVALALQAVILASLWLFMPDYPSKNPNGLNYFKMLYSILSLYRKHAVLMQTGLLAFCNSAIYLSYWTTITFLLSGAPYNFTPVSIGLFSLAGVGSMVLGPIYAKLFVQPYKPMFAVLLGESINLAGILIGTFIGNWSLAGPIIEAIAIDSGSKMAALANRQAIYAIEPAARSRVNTGYMVIAFLGQIVGTAAGNALYEQSGWRGSGGLNLGLIFLTFVICLARGPKEEGWFGWRGGWNMKLEEDTTEQIQEPGQLSTSYKTGES